MTKSIEYNLLAVEEECHYVVIDPEYHNDREALQFVADDLCADAEYCAVHFWDNVEFASTSAITMIGESRKARVAFYVKDKVLGERLEIYEGQP